MLFEGLIYFFAQRIDVDLYGVGVSIYCITPYFLYKIFFSTSSPRALISRTKIWYSRGVSRISTP